MTTNDEAQAGGARWVPVGYGYAKLTAAQLDQPIRGEDEMPPDAPLLIDAEEVSDYLNNLESEVAVLRQALEKAIWFVEWVAHSQVTPREAGMDIQAAKWLPGAAALRQRAGGGGSTMTDEAQAGGAR